MAKRLKIVEIIENGMIPGPVIGLMVPPSRLVNAKGDALSTIITNVRISTPIKLIFERRIPLLGSVCARRKNEALRGAAKTIPIL